MTHARRHRGRHRIDPRHRALVIVTAAWLSATLLATILLLKLFSTPLN